MAVLEAVGWMAGAEVGSIVAAAGLPRHEAREMKEFCKRLLILQRVAAARRGG